MNLRYQLTSIRRGMLALFAALVLALSAGGVVAYSIAANGTATAAPIACNGPCDDPGGGGG